LSNISQYVVSPYLPNAKYTFYLIPYNNQDISGTTTVTVPVFTLPIINNATAIGNSNEIDLTIDGWYDTFDLIVNSDTNNPIVGLSGTMYEYKNLFYNTAYTFSLIPYNEKPRDVLQPHLDGASFHISQTVYTLAIIQTANVVYDPIENKSTVSFSGYFSSYRVESNQGTNIPGTALNNAVVIDSNLSYNTDYCYNVVPINVNQEQGAVWYIDTLITTIPFVEATAKYIYDNYNNQWDIEILFTDRQYVYVVVSITHDSETVVSGHINAGIQNYVFNQVLPNTGYTITVTPYNRLNVPGTIVTINLPAYN
jgi:hypothetical protein